MGRPPIGEVAMTGSERVRRFRLKHPVTKPVTEHEARIRELEAECERLRAAVPPPSPSPRRVMPHAMFQKFKMCFHTDDSASDATKTEALNWLLAHQTALCGPKKPKAKPAPAAHTVTPLPDALPPRRTR